MNTTDDNQETSRPFGFWLKAVDRLMAAEFAEAFESFGVTRREWRLLNRVAGTVSDDARPIPTHKLDRLLELGWVTDADGTWTLTDEGREAKERLGTIVDGIRAKVTDAVPADDLATTIATLEQLARAFGWDENTPLPRGRGGHGHRHGFGRGPRGFGRGFGHGPRGFGHGRGHDGRAGHGFPAGQGFHAGPGGHAGQGAPDFGERRFGELVDCGHGRHPFAHGEGHGRHDRGHGEHGHGGRARFARFAQGAYERGFDAGFSRGRS